MAWYTDEQYEMIKDSREKKSIAASAFKQKTHCGKGGRVKFPSDYLSKKELKAMNGECKSYRMNDAISWSEFVEWPNEHKVAYIKRIREKFGVSDQYIAEMFGVATNMFLMYLKELGLEAKIKCDENWESNKFFAWRTGGRTELVNETVEEPEEQKTYEWNPMKWEEFKLLADEKKIEYIKWIRETFNANDGAIAEMLGMDRSWLGKMVISKFNLGRGKGSGHGKWDKEGFMKWCNKEEVIKEEGELVINEPTEIVIPCAGPLVVVEPENTEPQESSADKAFEEAKARVEEAAKAMGAHIREAGPIAFAGNSIPVIPKTGSMTFNGNHAEDILTTLKTLLGDTRVNMTVSWECEF